MDVHYQLGDEIVTVRVERAGAGYTVTIDDQVFAVETASWHDGELRLVIDGKRHTLFAAIDGPRRWVAANGRTFTWTIPRAGTKARRGHGAGPRHDSLEAQMPGVVRKVLVNPGDQVERGQALVVIEAMKMEIRVAAPHAGRVEQVAVREGESVQRGQLLVDLVESE